MKSKNILYIGVATAVILLIPFFTKAPWTSSDYIIAGLLLFGTGFILELVTSILPNKKNKLVAGAIIIALALYIWAELAVGIFTTLGS